MHRDECSDGFWRAEESWEDVMDELNLGVSPGVGRDCPADNKVT